MHNNYVDTLIPWPEFQRLNKGKPLNEIMAEYNKIVSEFNQKLILIEQQKINEVHNPYKTVKLNYTFLSNPVPGVPGGGSGSGGSAAESGYPLTSKGIVFLGRPNDTPWRLYVDDIIINNPQYVLEDGTLSLSQDITFPTQNDGIVLRGRTRTDAIYRIYVDDEDSLNPFLRFESINSGDITSKDYNFINPLDGPLLIARPAESLWRLYIYNVAGDLSDNETAILLEAAV